MTGSIPFPGGQTFRDVVVVPYSQLLDKWQDGEFHEGGPIWPDWDGQVLARHCRGGRPIDASPQPPGAIPQHVEALAWGGGIDPQFGHQVADFSARILGTILAHPELPIAFSSKPERGWRELQDTPVFFRQIVDWFGLGPDRIHLVDSPTLVGRLFVAPQAEQLDGPGPSTAYLDALDELAAARLSERPMAGVPVLYASRAGMTARFAGEAYLEVALESTGARVMRPETLPLLEQIRTYQASDHIIFAEGSAVHVLQLLGRVDADVGVVVRRGGTRIAEPNLRPRVRSLDYLDCTAGLLCGILPSGRPATHLGLSILREGAIPVALTSLGVRLGSSWRVPAFRTARDQDVLAWVDAQVARPDLHGPGSGEAIIDGLRPAGLGHLVDSVAARLRPLSERQRPVPRSLRADAPTLLFMHLPRSGGGAVRATLREVIPEVQRAEVYEGSPLDLAAFRARSESERAAPAVVMGDFAYGFHELVPGPSRYAVMLRHPISRILSLYRTAGRPGPSLEAWVFDDRRVAADNAAVRIISGRTDVPFGACTDDMLEAALAHIETDFAAVVLRSSMSRSAVVLGRALGMTLPPFPLVGADPAGEDSLDPPKPVRKRLRQLNHLDLELFRRYSDDF